VSALRLIRFVIKTRLSGGALALLLFIALVMLVTGLSMTFSKARSPPTPGFTELFRDYMTFMLVILMLTPLPAAAQMSVLKSDRDYLFTLPVRPRNLGGFMAFFLVVAFAPCTQRSSQPRPCQRPLWASRGPGSPSPRLSRATT